MKPRLYIPNQSFENNGKGFISEVIRCDVTQGKQDYFCELEVAPTDRLAKSIVPGNFVKAKPDHRHKPQIFEVNDVEVRPNGVVAATANHIKSYLMNDSLRVSTTDFSDIPLSGTADSVFSTIMNNTKLIHFGMVAIEGFDNTVETLSMKMGTPYTIAQLFYDDGGMIDKFGGAFDYDNMQATYKKNPGSDSGATLRYGSNISEYSQSMTNTDLYTGVYAFAKFSKNSDHNDITVASDNMLTGYKPNNYYYFNRVKAIDRSSHFSSDRYHPETEAGRQAIKAELDEWLTDYIKRKKKKLTEPRLNIRVTSPAQLAELQKVGLYDTVKVVYSPLNIVTKAKAIKTVYDSLTERYKEIEFGEKKLNLTNYIKKRNRS